MVWVTPVHLAMLVFANVQCHPSTFTAFFLAFCLAHIDHGQLPEALDHCLAEVLEFLVSTDGVNSWAVDTLATPPDQALRTFARFAKLCISGASIVLPFLGLVATAHTHHIRGLLADVTILTTDQLRSI